MSSQFSVGVVVIGRNEGERLRRCLRSLRAQSTGPMVYVDSGSTDGSVEFAKSLGVDVVDLDMSAPFTMARGRNAGFRRLAETQPGLMLVQFVDGDCEVEPDWIDLAVRTLHERPDVGVVCGRRRERFPQASIYNELTDMEWDAPAGEVSACGGDAMYRAEVFEQVGGFNAAMIAGEEPELCVRIRAASWKVFRLDAPMTLHDAALTRFGQWWTRTLRSGHAWAEGAALHGGTPARHNVREGLSALAYGAALPAAMILGVVLGLVAPAPLSRVGAALVAAGVLAYGALLVRVYRHRVRAGNTPRQARLYTLFCLIAKFAEVAGMLKYAANRVRGKRSGLIEYKTTTSS